AKADADRPGPGATVAGCHRRSRAPPPRRPERRLGPSSSLSATPPFGRCDGFGPALPLGIPRGFGRLPVSRFGLRPGFCAHREGGFRPENLSLASADARSIGHVSDSVAGMDHLLVEPKNY